MKRCLLNIILRKRVFVVGTKQQSEFSGLRAVLWPIHGWELKKFLPMGMMMICILAIYTMVREVKDFLVQSIGWGSSSSTASALKVTGVLVASLIVTWAFVKLNNAFEMQKVFYITTIFFLIFFVVFGFVIFPLSRSGIHASEQTVFDLQAKYPGFKDFISLGCNWSYALFYILAEMWGSLAIGTLFWQFANQTTRKGEVTRFYSLYGCIGNLGLIAVSIILWSRESLMEAAKEADKASNSLIGQKLGLTGKNLESFTKTRVGDEEFKAYVSSILIYTILVLVMGAVLLYLYNFINKKVLTDSRYYNASDVKGKKKEKLKMGMWQSFKMIAKSPYLMYILIIVLAYGVVMQLVEVILNDRTKLWGNFTGMKKFLTLFTAIFTIIAGFVGTNVLSRLKWKTAAAITPVITLTLSAVFFAFVFNGMSAGWTAGILTTVVWVGIAQDSLSKAVKYSIYDTTKQMTYRPLDPEEKVKAQAAIETIGGRLGKALGAGFVTLTRSLFFRESVISAAPCYAIVAIGICLVWIFAVFKLSPKYEKLNAEHEAQLKAK